MTCGSACTSISVPLFASASSASPIFNNPSLPPNSTRSSPRDSLLSSNELWLGVTAVYVADDADVEAVDLFLFGKAGLSASPPKASSTHCLIRNASFSSVKLMNGGYPTRGPYCNLSNFAAALLPFYRLATLSCSFIETRSCSFPGPVCNELLTCAFRSLFRLFSSTRSRCKCQNSF